MASEPQIDYVRIEPITGVTTYMRRSYTITYSLECLTESTQPCSTYAELPFPSLDAFKNMQIPVFNVTEEL